MSVDRIKSLESDGWVRQFETSEPRLSEAVEMYEEMGFEVHLEPIDTAAADKNRSDCTACRACFEGQEDKYKIIFTRK